jgi:transposase
MVDILDLPGLKTVSRHIDPYLRACYLEAKITYGQEICGNDCGSFSCLYKHTPERRTYRDTPCRENRVIIAIDVPRFYCRNCGDTFAQRVPWMDKHRKMTSRCVEWIREQSLHESYADIAERVGCSEKTVRNIAYEYLALLNDMHNPDLPEWLGIDEIAVGGRYRCVLTDIRQHRILDILQDREKLTIGKWLFARKSPNLKVVTMDMWKDFRRVVRDQFEDVPIVVDKFHIVRMANRAVDDVRIKFCAGLNKKERAKWMANRGLLRKRNRDLSKKGTARLRLDTWLGQNPALATAYYLKEEFYDIFDLLRRDEAERKLDDWRASVSKPMQEHFQELLSATKNWRTEILAYFDHREVTNAYTESSNNISRVADRMGRGYDFEVLRGRVLFADLTNPMEGGTSAEEMKALFDAHPNPPEWLMQYAESSRFTDDISALERRKSIHRITWIQNGLVKKHGDLCQACGGKLERKLLDFHQSLPHEANALVTRAFELYCTQCRKPFVVLSPMPPFPEEEKPIYGSSTEIRAADLLYLRDPTTPKLPRRPKKHRNWRKRLLLLP